MGAGANGVSEKLKGGDPDHGSCSEAESDGLPEYEMGRKHEDRHGDQRLWHGGENRPQNCSELADPTRHQHECYGQSLRDVVHRQRRCPSSFTYISGYSRSAAELFEEGVRQLVWVKRAEPEMKAPRWAPSLPVKDTPIPRPSESEWSVMTATIRNTLRKSLPVRSPNLSSSCDSTHFLVQMTNLQHRTQHPICHHSTCWRPADVLAAMNAQ